MGKYIFLILGILSIVITYPVLSPVRSQEQDKVTVQSVGGEKTAAESDAATAESPTSHLVFAGVGVIAIAVIYIILKKKLFGK